MAWEMDASKATGDAQNSPLERVLHALAPVCPPVGTALASATMTDHTPVVSSGRAVATPSPQALAHTTLRHATTGRRAAAPRPP
jgi:hypothetical protein